MITECSPRSGATLVTLDRVRSPRKGGQVLAEFAVILPICILMLAGIVDLGLLLQHHIAVQTVLREGALFASRPGVTDQQIREAMVALPGGNGLKAQEITVTRLRPDPSLADLDAGNGVTAQIPGGPSHYETVEVRISTHHYYMMPGFFPGGSVARVTSSIKTFQVVP